MALDRLARVTDLFVEGTEVHLGADRDGRPVLIWVNKLNSFEVEETRRDGMAHRSQRILELSDETNPEFLDIRNQVHRWSDDDLAQYRVNQMAEEIYLETLNEIEADEEWREKIAMLRRLPQLLDDAATPAGDSKREDLLEQQNAYLNELRERQNRKNLQHLADVKGRDRADVEAEFLDNWRQRLALDVFIAERRVTELFYAMRDCKATRAGERDGKTLWDHTDCDHNSRLLDDRKQVYTLSDEVTGRCIDALEGITVPQRDAGNSDAPASSSESSGPSSTSEALPVPSSPEAMPVAAPTT